MFSFVLKVKWRSEKKNNIYTAKLREIVLVDLRQTLQLNTEIQL